MISIANIGFWINGMDEIYGLDQYEDRGTAMEEN